MTKILLLLALAIPPGLAAKFDAPKWALLLSAAPFGLLAMSMGDSDEHLLGEGSEKAGRYLLLLVGLGGLAFGLIAWSLRGTSTLLGAFWWLLPISLVVTVVAVVRLLRK